MIKAVVQDKSGPVLFLMLTQENIDRLQKKLPIMVDMAALGLPAGRVVIGYGVDQAAAVEELRLAGLPVPEDMPEPKPGEVVDMSFRIAD